MSNLTSHINKAEEIELSGADIVKITDNKALPIAYHNLEKINTLDELFDKSNVIMLLYELREINEGHWVVLMKIDNNTVEFFDPFGLEPDQELKFSPLFHRLHKGNVIPHLTFLLQNSNYDLIVNKCKLQANLGTVNTCGRHCCCRVKFRDLTLDEYCKLFKKNKYNADFMVTTLTILYSL